MKYYIKVTKISTDNENVKALFDGGCLFIRQPNKGDAEYKFFKNIGGHLCGVKSISSFESSDMAEDFAARNAWKWRKQYGDTFTYEIIGE